jgi:uncharacterized protein (TIGR03437 family)
VKWLVFSCVLMSAVFAAPMLRLGPSSVVTAWVAAGATAPSQTLIAGNVGDGSLSLSASVAPSVAWLAVTVGGSEVCPAYFNGTCNPIQFTFKSATLAAGTYTASVTVSDPNAIDSPQVVIVTLQVGMAVDQYAAPGSKTNVPFPFSCDLGFCTAKASTADGGNWLSVVVFSAGTFSAYESIEVAPPATMPAGNYSGTVSVSGDITQSIPVTMHLTTLPIAVPSTNQINVTLAQNGPPSTYPFLPYISLTNSGMGTLQVTGVSAIGAGVNAYNYNGLAIVTVDPGGLAPGVYTDGMVTIQCNGANCPVQVPVSLEVDPQGPPIVNYRGAVDNATFSPTGSPGDVMIVKGSQLSLQAPQTASGTPLPTSLGGAGVLVNGVATPLYYSSFGQIAFQARADTYLGTALVQVIRDRQASNTVSVNMAPYSPGIVVVTDTSYNLVDATHPAHAGETLVFWALGLGMTNPAVADGTAAPNPPALVTVPVSVQFGLEFFSNTTMPSFVGLSPGSVGLYQVIATLPASTPAGTVSASLLLAGAQSNRITLAVQ